MTPAPMQHLQPQVVDLANQKPGKYVLTMSSLAGQILPIYIDNFEIDEGMITGLRDLGDDKYTPIVVVQADSAKIFATDILVIKTWEQMQREGMEEMAARQKLEVELDPAAHEHVYIKEMGIVPRKVAEAAGLQDAILAMRKDREYIPPSGSHI